MINHHINHNNSQIMFTNTMKKDNQFALLFNGFVFGKKNERINWRKIAAVDLERVSREVDVDVLQDNIEQITFCNIESEIDSRMIDPNFIKLFKMSQLIIEYLLECQRQLVEYTSSSKGQLDETYSEINELKKINEVLQKDLTELKKENKRRKKMIEIQQNMISSNSTNYHRCAYCSKAFLNAMYLQAHMNRRHAQMPQIQQQQQQPKISPEIEMELEKIKEKLRETEHQLIQERNARFSTMSNMEISKEESLLKKFEEWKEAQKKVHMQDMKAMEEKFLREIEELRIKNSYSERALTEFEKKLGKQSNVGQMQDELDELVMKQQDENSKLKHRLETNKADFAKQYDDVNSKWKAKIEKSKEKYERELDEKDAIIEQLTAKLSSSKKQRVEHVRSHPIEKEEEQPPPITPRISGRSPSPTKQLIPQTIIQSTLNRSNTVDMYLPDYCPLTKNALLQNPNILSSYKEVVKQMFNSQLDDIGIYIDDKTLSNNDFKMKINDLIAYRKNLGDDIKPQFNHMRKIFADICNESCKRKLTSSLKSSSEFRVKFQKNPVKHSADDDNSRYSSHKRSNIAANKLLSSYSHGDDKSSSELSEVSVPNAVESNDDDTEPTKPFSNPIVQSVMSHSKHDSNKNYNNIQPQAPPKVQQKAYYDDEDDDISDLDLNDKTEEDDRNKNNKPVNTGGSVKKTANLIEKQILDINKKGIKPSSNAIPTFKSASPYKKDDEVSDVSVSSLEGSEDGGKAPKNNKMMHNQRSLDTTSNTSIWASVSHGGNHQTNGRNSANLHRNDAERPTTANSIRSSQFDSDEYLE